MNNLIEKLLRPKWSYEKAIFAETTKSLPNPARGWYHIFPFFAENAPDFEAASWGLKPEETLALVIINIGAYREKLLDAPAIDNIRKILVFFKEHSYDMILRIAYDHEGNALEREPFFFKLVTEHMEQLLPVLTEFSENIFVFQGLLIGNWGEMHTSRFLAPEKIKQLWNILKDASLPETYLAVRRPSFWRLLHLEQCGKEEVIQDTTGLFDDAIFGSENHLGTFGTQAKEMCGWEEPWSREEELKFEYELCQKVPNGGEVIYGENYIENFSPQETVNVLEKMHITYLNQAYDERILSFWKQRKWETAGVWKNHSVYEYIEAHLGYRFYIADVLMSRNKKTGEAVLEIEVGNSGFASCYQETELFIEVQKVNETSEKIALDYDIRTLESNARQCIRVSFSPVEGLFYLEAKRKKDGKIIFFANDTEKNGKVFLGKMLQRKSL